MPQTGGGEAISLLYTAHVHPTTRVVFVPTTHAVERQSRPESLFARGNTNNTLLQIIPPPPFPTIPYLYLPMDSRGVRGGGGRLSRKCGGGVDL